MTTNQVVFGLACGSIDRLAAERQLGDHAPRPSEWITGRVTMAAGRPLGPPVPDAEADDLHGGRPAATVGGGAWPVGRPGSARVVAGRLRPDRRLGMGKLEPREVALRASFGS